MRENEMIALRAKVKVANTYLNECLKIRGKINNSDIYRVVRPGMRDHVKMLTVPEIRMLWAKYQKPIRIVTIVTEVV